MNKLPFDKKKVNEIMKYHPTPFHIYDEGAIIDNARRFNKAFGILPEFKNYFAVKALPNPAILQFLKEEGCVSGKTPSPSTVVVIGMPVLSTNSSTSL